MSGRVVILGSGIIGLASALAAAGRGLAVNIVDSGRRVIGG